MKKYVITGSPHSGKTRVVRELANRGYQIKQETATDFIGDYSAKTNGRKLQEDCINLLEFLIFLEQSKREDALTGDMAFLDRGLNDLLAYINYKKIDLDKAAGQARRLVEEESISEIYGYDLTKIDFGEVRQQMSDAFCDADRYEKQVFLLEQVPDDKKPDEIRTSTPETRAELVPFIRQAYSDAGYEIVDVPFISGEEGDAVRKRADFILSKLDFGDVI